MRPLDMSSGGDPSGPMCNACKAPIGKEPATRIHFPTDPLGHQGLTGDYHLVCSKPYAALARVLRLNPWGR